jgi:hypothetical protein
MKLTTIELKLIAGISKNRKRRKWDALATFLVSIILATATFGFGMFPALSNSMFLGVAVGASIMWLIHVYFGVRSEDKFVDLLQRYINRDPEAVAQIAAASEAEQVAA